MAAGALRSIGLGLLAFGATAVGGVVVVSMGGAPPPRVSCINPCPRRQLLAYVAHTGGVPAPCAATVYARPRRGAGEWSTVGRVACVDEGEGEGEGECGTELGEASREASLLEGAIQTQQRLIAEHAGRLHPTVRAANRDRRGGETEADVIELGMVVGLQARGGAAGDADAAAQVVPVAPTKLRDFVPGAYMTKVGFVGLPKRPRNKREASAAAAATSTADARPASASAPAPAAAPAAAPATATASSDIYSQFAAHEALYGARYDREAVRAEIEAIVSQHAIVAFGWSTCFFCVEAARLLREAGHDFQEIDMVNNFKSCHEVSP